MILAMVVGAISTERALAWATRPACKFALL